MNPILEIVRNAALVTVAVVLGFCVGSALGLPVWLQGFFLIPAMLQFYSLAGERRPALWKIVGFTAFLAIFVLLVSLGFRHVPEEYFWIYFILIALVPFGPILNWFERRFTPTKDKCEQDAPSNGG
jgi:hypothetical protein